MPIVCATMHVTWGIGFIVGLQERPAGPALAT
jgi:hypothetical protein